MYDREDIILDARAELEIRRSVAQEAAEREAQRMAQQVKRVRRLIARSTYVTRRRLDGAVEGLLRDVLRQA